MTRVSLVEHDPAWTDAFVLEAARIRVELGTALVAMHHIGSTAIPGIIAKPVIDMLAEVHSVAVLESQSQALAGIGYEALGEFGIAGRRYFRKDAPDGTRTHQLHAFAVGSHEIRRHLAFRDFLRAHPADAHAYAALKRALARDAVDSRAYTEAKTEFVRAIDQKALLWWGGEHGDAATLAGGGAPSTDRVQLRITLPAALRATIDDARLRWTPEIATNNPAHLTLIYHDEAPDVARLSARLAHACTEQRPFVLQLGAVRQFAPPDAGAFLEVADPQGGVRRLRELVLAPPFTSRSRFGLHVTVLHPAYGARLAEAWPSLLQLAHAGTFTADRVELIAGRGAATRTLATFTLGGGSTAGA